MGQCPQRQTQGKTQMNRAEMVELIRGGVPGAGGVWADLGAGTGNFTEALRGLLGAQGAIYADITQRLTLPPLDGVLVANALHFIRDQAAALALIASYLRPSGRLLIVEYDLAEPLRWLPFPVPFTRFQALAEGAGLHNPAQIGRAH